MKNLLDRLHGVKWFTTLALKAGYNQVRTHEGHIARAAFLTPYGLFEPVVMPFGLCNAPALFQRMCPRTWPR